MIGAAAAALRAIVQLRLFLRRTPGARHLWLDTGAVEVADCFLIALRNFRINVSLRMTGNFLRHSCSVLSILLIPLASRTTDAAGAIGSCSGCPFGWARISFR